MFADRFTNETTAVADRNTPQPQAFYLVSVAAAAAAPQASPLQWLYQQMYQQAQQAHAQPTQRELFAVMN